MSRLAALLLLFISMSVYSYAQTAVIRGQLVDSVEKTKLSNAVVALLRQKDTTLVNYTRADAKGNFSFPSIDSGKYLVLITYPKFADYMETVEVKGNVELGNVFLTLKSKVLQEVVIRSGSAIRIKGDTTEFVADSFRLKEGATVEDLLKKLPGFTVNSKGEIVAQGKKVDKVLVDGEEFFGDDPTMATQNISGKAVDRVQLFDTKSEQQNLTGMTTGTEGKTINIKLKEDFKKGYFGKVYAGSDFNKYHDAKGLFNKFVGKKKISVYATKTNVSTGSLNWEDREKLGIEEDYEYDEISGFYYSFGGNDEFDSWNFRGLPNAITAGGLYSNKWNQDKNNLNTSYRYNRLQSENIGTTLSQNILPTGLSYTNTYTGRNALNQQHAFNLKYEWKIDSLTSIKFTSVNSYKFSDADGYSNSEYLDGNRDTVNRSFRDYKNHSEKKQTDNQVTYKQLFKKKNRQWNTVFRYGITQDENEGINNTVIRYFNQGVFATADTIDQQKLFDGKSTTIGVKSTFSEPLSTKFTLVLDYAFNKNHSVSHRNTFEKSFNGKYDVLVNEFSNNFELDAYSHSGNAILRYMYKKVNAAIGSGVSTVKLGLENLDNSNFNNYHFLNITPQAQFVYTPKPQYNLRFGYRGTTRQPTINQLQPLKDNTDPLNVYVGNPDLKVGFNHSFNLGFNRYKTLSQSWLGINANFNIQENAITQYNTIDAQGKRTYMPVNVSGNNNWYIWSQINKNNGPKKLGYGVSINGNGGRFVNFINGTRAVTKTASAQAFFNLFIQAEEKYEFSIGPMIGYNISNSSLPTSIDNNYFVYGGRLNAEVTLPWKIEISTNMNADLRQKINAFATNTNLVIWNAEISKKLFKNNVGKISFLANDILNDNKGFTRTINSTFISDDRYMKVSRYFLLKFEWTFTKMPGAEKK